LKEFQRLHTRMQHMSSHTGAYLLTHALGVQKVIYFLRSSPAFKAREALRDLDTQIRATAENITKLRLHPEGIAQFYLPIKSGGHGIRLPSSLALPCFLSSSFSCSDGVRANLGSSEASIAHQTEALNEWRELYDTLPEEDQRIFQREWDQISISKSHSQLRSSVTGLDAVRMASVSRIDSGQWLHALPSKSLGTLLSDDEYRVVCALRYGIDLFDKQRCSCGEMVDPKALHLLSCRQGSMPRDARHNEINDLLLRAMRQARVSVCAEPTNLNETDGIRPDGLTLQPWSHGQSLIWDVTVRDTYAPSYRTICRTPGAVAGKAERDKRTKYSCLLQRYMLMVFAIESTGVWGKEASDFITELGRRVEHVTGESRSAAFLRQRISLAVQRGNARMVLQCMQTALHLTELFCL